MDTFRRKPLPSQPSEENMFYLSGQLEKKMDCKTLLFSPQSFKEHILFTCGDINDICINMELSFTAAFVPHFDRSQVPSFLMSWWWIVELDPHDIVTIWGSCRVDASWYPYWNVWSFNTHHWRFYNLTTNVHSERGDALRYRYAQCTFISHSINWRMVPLKWLNSLIYHTWKGWACRLIFQTMWAIRMSLRDLGGPFQRKSTRIRNSCLDLMICRRYYSKQGPRKRALNGCRQFTWSRVISTTMKSCRSLRRWITWRFLFVNVFFNGICSGILQESYLIII